MTGSGHSTPCSFRTRIISCSPSEVNHSMENGGSCLYRAGVVAGQSLLARASNVAYIPYACCVCDIKATLQLQYADCGVICKCYMSLPLRMRVENIPSLE